MVSFRLTNAHVGDGPSRSLLRACRLLASPALIAMLLLFLLAAFVYAGPGDIANSDGDRLGGKAPQAIDPSPPLTSAGSLQGYEQ